MALADAGHEGMSAKAEAVSLSGERIDEAGTSGYL